MTEITFTSCGVPCAAWHLPAAGGAFAGPRRRLPRTAPRARRRAARVRGDHQHPRRRGRLPRDGRPDVAPSHIGYTRMHPAAGSRVSEADGKATMPVEAVAPAIVWLASDSCSETNSIYSVEAGAIQRIAIVTGPGFYDQHLTPESIAENYAKVESIEGFSEPSRFEPGIQIPATD